MYRKYDVALWIRSTAVIAGLAIAAAPEAARGDSTLTVNLTNPAFAPVTQTFDYKDANQLTAVLTGQPNQGLTSAAANNIATGITGTTNLRGQTVTFSSAPGSVGIVVSGAGLQKTFNSQPTRVLNGLAALSYLQDHNAAGLFNSVSAGNSTANPAVGNPTSLVGTMVSRDFKAATGIGDLAPDLSGSSVAVPNAITAGGEFSYAATKGTDIRQVTLPLGYTIYLADPLYSIAVDMPLTYMNVGGSTVVQGSLGTSFKFPVRDNWSLSAGVRAGAVGSTDLLLGNIAYSGTFGSQYRLNAGNYGIILGNAVGAVKTSGFTVHGIPSGVDRTNVPFINGVSIEGSLPYTVFDKPTSFEAYVVDTYYAGQTLPIQHYDEIGLNVGTRRLPGDQSWNTARFGIAYTGGRSFNMVSLRGSYKF